jgi:acetyl esterase/lipase
MNRQLLAFALALCLVTPLLAAEPRPWTVRDSVVYARVDNVALTYDVFTPSTQNGAAVINILSGGWVSSKATGPGAATEACKRGYTVFNISHGSTPRFTIDEIVPQVKRAIRHIRAHAAEYNIDPNRFAVTGGSAGGHLSLMIATTADPGDAKAKDPVDRMSSAVQCVGSFYPPTDFLNYGKRGENAIGQGKLAPYRGAFAFHELSENRRWFVPITDEPRVIELGKAISPIYHISASCPPILLIHGDADSLVPIQQSQ